MTQLIPNFIDGEAVASQNSIPKYNPFNHEILSYLSNSEPLDFIKSIQPAQKAFLQWNNSTIEERLQLLDKIKLKLSDYKNQFVMATAQDLALPRSFVETADFNVALEKIEYQKIELVEHHPNDSVQFSAIGPIGFILSSNLPLRLFVENVLPAILAGNTAVIKFSSTSASFVSVFVQMLTELNLIRGLVQVVSGNSTPFKNFFVTHPAFKALCVTGTNETLQDIQKQVSLHFQKQNKKLKFLGGSKNLTIVLKEVNQVQADEIFETFVMGQGQLHWNAARLFVLEKNQKFWIDFIKEKMFSIKPSTSIEDPSLWSPIFRSRSVSHAKYEEISKQAQSDQAKLISPNDIIVSSERSLNLKVENFLKPIFTQDMSNCSSLQQDQMNSPFYILSTVKYPFDIPKYANVSYYGDTANIWGESGAGQKVISGLEVANVSLNKWSIFSAKQVAGVKQSSFGITDHKIFGTFYSNVKIVT
jgi:acyl-CoA reductase-like NAD-dependent aldehyde dehydrogenase